MKSAVKHSLFELQEGLTLKMCCRSVLHLTPTLFNPKARQSTAWLELQGVGSDMGQPGSAVNFHLMPYLAGENISSPRTSSC